MDKILNFLGLIRKAGFLETGEENTGMAVRSGKCRLLLLAADASPNAKRRAEGFLQNAKDTPLLILPFIKAEISQATGRAGCSMAAVTDIGFASAIAGKLCELELDEYADASKLLSEKKEKADRRRAEAVASKRNKMAGKLRRNKV